MITDFLPTPSPEGLYPDAPAMPPVVATPIEDLLQSYAAFLESNAPELLAGLQPGLTDMEIDELEAAHAFKLTSDLRALF